MLSVFWSISCAKVMLKNEQTFLDKISEQNDQKWSAHKWAGFMMNNLMVFFLPIRNQTKRKLTGKIIEKWEKLIIKEKIWSWLAWLHNFSIVRIIISCTVWKFWLFYDTLQVFYALMHKNWGVSKKASNWSMGHCKNHSMVYYWLLFIFCAQHVINFRLPLRNTVISIMAGSCCRWLRLRGNLVRCIHVPQVTIVWRSM